MRTEPLRPGEGPQSLLDLLDPHGRDSVALWMKLGRPVLGIDAEPLKDGCRLKSVDPAGGAGKAGFQVGDVITEVAGKSLVDPDSIKVALKRFSPGDKVIVNSFRGTNSVSRTVTLGYFQIPFVVRNNQARQDLDADHRRFLDAGYRPAHLVTYASRKGQARYAGLWVKDGVPFLWQLESTSDAFHKQCRELPPGYRPARLDISGDADSRRWSCVWLEDKDRVPWQQHEDLSRSALLALIGEPATGLSAHDTHRLSRPHRRDALPGRLDQGWHRVIGAPSTSRPMSFRINSRPCPPAGVRSGWTSAASTVGAISP